MNLIRKGFISEEILPPIILIITFVGYVELIDRGFVEGRSLFSSIYIVVLVAGAFWTYISNQKQSDLSDLNINTQLFRRSFSALTKEDAWRPTKDLNKIHDIISSE